MNIIDEYIKKPMSIDFVKEIVEWKYEGEYTVYNMPPLEKISNYRILNPENFNDYVCYIKNDELMAYISLNEKADGVYLGIGLKPEYCSKNMGRLFLEDSILIAQNRYKNKSLKLIVRTFNKRAIKAYKKVGFSKIDTIYKKENNNIIEFLVMQYKA